MGARHTAPSTTDSHPVTPRPSTEQLEVLASVVRYVARSSRLSPDDALDFGQYVQLRLLEADYEPFVQFAGHSSFRTYLAVVVRRMLLDWHRSQCGKWRPSAVAVRLGTHGILLESLIYRDGHTVDEAVGIAAMQRGAPPAAELRGLASSLPPREARRLVPIERIAERRGVPFEDPLEKRQQQEAAAGVLRILEAALRDLSAEDRELLALRYRCSQRVSVTAASLGVNAKVLYRRYERLLRVLRRSLETAGVTALVRNVW